MEHIVHVGNSLHSECLHSEWTQVVCETEFMWETAGEPWAMDMDDGGLDDASTVCLCSTDENAVLLWLIHAYVPY